MAKKTARQGRVHAGRVVAAAGSAGGGDPSAISATAIEEAMNQAALDALSHGITDPNEIRELKLKARVKAKSRHAMK